MHVRHYESPLTDPVSNAYAMTAVNDGSRSSPGGDLPSLRMLFYGGSPQLTLDALAFVEPLHRRAVARLRARGHAVEPRLLSRRSAMGPARATPRSSHRPNRGRRSRRSLRRRRCRAKSRAAARLLDQAPEPMRSGLRCGTRDRRGSVSRVAGGAGPRMPRARRPSARKRGR